MEMRELWPYLAAGMAAIASLGVLWRRLWRGAIEWDAIVAATVLTGVAVAIVCLPPP